MDTTIDEIRRQEQEANQRVTRAREQLAEVVAANGAQFLETLALDPKLELVVGRARKLKNYGRKKPEEELQIEQVFLRECKTLERLRLKLEIFDYEEKYKKASHDLCVARIGLHVEKAQCQASLEHQTRELMELQRQIDAGERDEGLLIARKQQDEVIKRSYISFKTRIVGLESMVGFHAHLYRMEKRMLDMSKENGKRWEEIEAETL